MSQDEHTQRGLVGVPSSYSVSQSLLEILLHLLLITPNIFLRLCFINLIESVS